MSWVPLVLLEGGVGKLHPRYMMRAYLDFPATQGHRSDAMAERLAVTFPCLAVMGRAKAGKFLEGAWRGLALVSAGVCVESCSREGHFLE